MKKETIKLIGEGIMIVVREMFIVILIAIAVLFGFDCILCAIARMQYPVVYTSIFNHFRLHLNGAVFIVSLMVETIIWVNSERANKINDEFEMKWRNRS